MSNTDKRKEWRRDLRVFKEQFVLRAKLGVIDGLIREEEAKPKLAVPVDWGTPTGLAFLFSDIKRGVPSTELLRLIVRIVLSMPFLTHDTDAVDLVFSRVLIDQNANLRKMYGVFDETEAS